MNILQCFFTTKRLVKVIFSTNNVNFKQATLVCYRTWKIAENMAQENVLKPPKGVRGLIELDKTRFDKKISVPVIFFKDVKISKVSPILKKYFLKLEHFRPIQSTESETQVYLNPNLVQKYENIDEDDRKKLESENIRSENLKNVDFTLGYDNFSAETIFKSVLPTDKEGMASFTIIGHIAHVNLREHLLPFKKLIGEVLLDKIKGLKTVVNKIDMINNTYRNFQMEILAGVNDFQVKLKENCCTFEFDFSTVYWNSRLCTEHERIVKIVQKDDVLFDVFSGVGPFSVPIAKKGAKVFANDLNPESFKWLNHNIKTNKIKPENITTYNKDGADFIKKEIKENLLKFVDKKKVHITMNLPGLAVEFLKNFVNLYTPEELKKDFENPPIVYVYCFAKGENYTEIAKNLVNTNIGADISKKIVDIFKVRTVSSMKEMMRITFKLDRDILVGNILKNSLPKRGNDEICNTNPKKHCVNPKNG